jgi:hypothetical protein
MNVEVGVLFFKEEVLLSVLCIEKALDFYDGSIV